ncbi:MAG: DUF2892 domain-containing protein [Gammaproteobacteria bacterium]|nr:DUF2892 domain-containing protein [Gammaproteobacteria bacterium]
MEKQRDYFVEQNIGVIERCLRVVLGFAMLGYPYYLIIQPGATVEMWQSVLMVLSVYPCITGILGCDPMYTMFKVRTCSVNGRNQCGSFPYQIDALLGRDPKPENHLEHTLLHSDHVKHA